MFLPATILLKRTILPGIISFKTCHPGTRIKVLKITSDWIDEDDVIIPVLCLHGLAGSANAQTIAERFIKDGKLAASYFFLRTKLNYGTADLLFRTLAWQLINYILETAIYIASAVKADPLLPTKSIEMRIDRLIVRPLERAPGGNRPKKNVIECGGERTRRRILKLIADESVGPAVPIQFLISNKTKGHLAMDLFAMKQFVLDDGWKDVRIYLEDELARICYHHALTAPQWLTDCLQ